MNYIVLNGVKSNTVKGLLIQSLPPISKPLIRTTIEEIDGRDGDIVTKLGYSAYNKEVVIGLYGDYDIDDVIKYFNSEGVVIFSNEPDKYYRYSIIDQIDFERLIRFKTATVTMHVQPFKYSSVDKTFIYDKNNLLKFKDITLTKDGVTASVQNGVVSISGTHTKAVEFYLPIELLKASPSTYTLTGTADGLTTSCAIRLINETPSSANSFGGTYLSLVNDSDVRLSASLTEAKTYNYVWIYLGTSGTEDFSFSASFNDTASSGEITVINRGNTVSRPIIKIEGSGTINLSLNGTQIFVINLGDLGEITIDTEQMNAYTGEMLLNRRVTGDYDNFKLNAGRNVISWSGNIQQIEIDNYSRWI